MSVLHILRIVMCIGMLTVCFGCGTETEDEEDADPGTTTALLSFTDDIRACTPYLGEGASEEWSDWDPAELGSIFTKLFDPDRGGDECIYTHIEILDTHIGLVNEFRDDWDTDGEYTNGDVTISIDTSVSTVTIPYLGGFFSGLISIQVDREVYLEGPEGLIIHMAFTSDGTTQTIVEQYEQGGADAGVYYAFRDGSTIRIWHASVRDSLVQFMWEGALDEQWFRITECTNYTGNWEVMGGGSIAESDSLMSFMARNDEMNDSRDEFYLTISYEDLLGGVEQEVYDAADVPPSGSGVLAYITEGDPKCLGFLGTGQFPATPDDLDWNQ
ncbi:MAG: hypothetical protein ACP5G0_13520 [Desulfomonilia bacterium]